MKKFTDRINESSEYWMWKTKKITDEWFNNASNSEISR